MHLVQILLPVFDNGDRPIPPLQLRRVSQELADRFGGVTAYTRGPAEGMWRESEKTSHDDIVVIEVMVDDLERAWWAGYRSDLEKRFGQEEIIIRAHQIERL